MAKVKKVSQIRNNLSMSIMREYSKSMKGEDIQCGASITSSKGSTLSPCCCSGGSGIQT